ncbi:hypothetical protein JYT19_01025 [Sulfobacillus acidophilus]|uniref:Uncharacterized protein n=1 Tax=Sulfobacillus acidophilus TaxID=53633 RepID=A0ABS3AZ02_9FIRM|nr:hypothetical protein [Sulfobacillus acidophilus]
MTEDIIKAMKERRRQQEMAEIYALHAKLQREKNAVIVHSDLEPRSGSLEFGPLRLSTKK